MSDNREQRQNWRTNWLNSIQEFADDDTQRRLWLDPTNANPHFSYVDIVAAISTASVCQAAAISGALEQHLLSADEAAAVTEFHARADAYVSPTDDYDHEAILADPKWTRVVAAAQGAQASLLTLIDDPRERRLLTER